MVIYATKDGFDRVRRRIDVGRDIANDGPLRICPARMIPIAPNETERDGVAQSRSSFAFPVAVFRRSHALMGLGSRRETLRKFFLRQRKAHSLGVFGRHRRRRLPFALERRKVASRFCRPGRGIGCRHRRQLSKPRSTLLAACTDRPRVLRVHQTHSKVRDPQIQMRLVGATPRSALSVPHALMIVPANVEAFRCVPGPLNEGVLFGRR